MTDIINDVLKIDERDQDKLQVRESPIFKKGNLR